MSSKFKSKASKGPQIFWVLVLHTFYEPYRKIAKCIQLHLSIRRLQFLELRANFLCNF